MSSVISAADDLRGEENEPLKPEELRMIARLFSDPTVFPRDFKRWVTDHSSDTVDIARSQVHGLINSSGQVVPGVAEVFFQEFVGGVSYPSGGSGTLVSAPTVNCDGFPIEVSFYAPYCSFGDFVADLFLDGSLQGHMGRWTRSGTTVNEVQPITFLQRLRPASGNHAFRVDIRSINLTTVIVAGIEYPAASAEFYGKGYFRISKA